MMVFIKKKRNSLKQHKQINLYKEKGKDKDTQKTLIFQKNSKIIRTN